MSILFYTKVVSPEERMFAYSGTSGNIPIKIFEDENGLAGYKDVSTGKIKVSAGMKMTYDLLIHLATVEEDMYQTIKGFAKIINSTRAFMHKNEFDFSFIYATSGYKNTTKKFVRNQKVNGEDIEQLSVNAKILEIMLQTISASSADTYHDIFKNPTSRMLIDWSFSWDLPHDSYSEQEVQFDYIVPMDMYMTVWVSTRHDNMDTNTVYRGNHTVNIGTEQQYIRYIRQQYLDDYENDVAAVAVSNMQIYYDHLHTGTGLGEEKGVDQVNVESVYCSMNPVNSYSKPCCIKIKVKNGYINCERGNEFDPIKYNFIIRRFDKVWNNEYVFWYKNCYQFGSEGLSPSERKRKYGIVKTLNNYLGM